MVMMMNCNYDCKNCKKLHKNDLRFIEGQGTTYNPKCWVQCRESGVWADTVYELADKVKEDKKLHPWRYETSQMVKISDERANKQKTLDDF